MIDCSFGLNDRPMSSFIMGVSSFPAFSGLNKHVDRAISQCIPNQDPIPKGNYHILVSSIRKIAWAFKGFILR